MRTQHAERKAQARTEKNAALVNVRNALARIEADVHGQAQDRAEVEAKQRSKVRGADKWSEE